MYIFLLSHHSKWRWIVEITEDDELDAINTYFQKVLKNSSRWATANWNCIFFALSFLGFSDSVLAWIHSNLVWGLPLPLGRETNRKILFTEHVLTQKTKTFSFECGMHFHRRFFCAFGDGAKHRKNHVVSAEAGAIFLQFIPFSYANGYFRMDDKRQFHFIIPD